MAGKPKLVYLDSCAFVAWMTDDRANHTSDTIEAIGEIIRSFRAGEIVLVTSTVTKIEVLKLKNQDEDYHRYELVVGHPNFAWVDCNIRVVELASEIRQSLIKEKRLGRLISTSTPDSLHLASALYARCEVFHTTDGKNPLESKERKLLPLQRLTLKWRGVDFDIPIEKPTLPPAKPAEEEPAVDEPVAQPALSSEDGVPMVPEGPDDSESHEAANGDEEEDVEDIDAPAQASTYEGPA